MIAPGSGAPAFFDHVNVVNSITSPTTVHSRNTNLTNYFMRYLLLDAISVLEWRLPKHWAKNYFTYSLYLWGFVAVINTDKYGVIPQACGLRGYNVMYQPTHAIISNPLLRGIREPMIGKDTELIQLYPDYCGIYDLLSYYADMMSVASEGVAIGILNSKMAYIFGAASKTAAESLKKAYDQLQAGNPAIFIDKSLFDDEGRLTMELFTQDVGQNYIVDKLLIDLRKIRNEFLTAIGIRNSNLDKRERLTDDEVHENDEETRARPALSLETIREGVDKVNAMFDLSISVDFRKMEEEPMEGTRAEVENEKKRKTD